MKKRILSIVLTICMVFMLMPTVVLASEVTVTTEEELRAAVQTGGTINLGADIALNEPLIVNNNPAGSGFSLTLNMNGYTLTGTIELTACRFTLNGRLDANVKAEAYVDSSNSWPSNLYGGTYAGKVYCNTTNIMSGTFLNRVSGQGGISGGTFYNDVNCEDITGGSFFGSCTVTERIWAGIFYGGYEQNKVGASYTVRYNSDDKVHAIEFRNEHHESFLGAEAPSKKGYSFLGWYEKDTNGEFLETPMNFPISSNNFLRGTVNDVYALWKDVEVPVISDIEDGKTYCEAVEFEVSDNDGVASVKAGDNELTATNGKYTLAKGIGTVTVVATDNAGNSANVTVTVNSGHTDITPKDHVCDICGEIVSVHNLEKIPAKDATVTEIGNKEYWHCKDCGKYFSDENGKSEINDLAAWKAEEGKLAKLPPEIINGKGMSIAAGENKELTFRSNADFSDFIRVELDGKILDAKYYTAKEGSTIITLKADYVASLSTGNHTISIVSTSGTATTEFTVNAQAASGNDSPKTGDNSNLLLWLALMILGASGTAGAAVCFRKKRTNE